MDNRVLDCEVDELEEREAQTEEVPSRNNSSGGLLPAARMAGITAGTMESTGAERTVPESGSFYSSLAWDCFYVSAQYAPVRLRRGK